MQRRKIDIVLYGEWLIFLMAMFFLLFTSFMFYQMKEEKLFDLFFRITVGLAVVEVTMLTINVAIIPIILRIRILIDKKRNPEKYKALAEMHREIDKMMTELDEEIEKIIKEAEDGKH